MSKNNYENAKALLQEYGQCKAEKAAQNDRMNEIKEQLETLYNGDLKKLVKDNKLEIEGAGQIRYAMESAVATTKKFSPTQFWAKFRGLCDIKISVSGVSKMMQDGEVKKELTSMGVSLKKSKSFKVEPSSN